ncbi:MAG: MFS transporter [Actinomycetes bacterium]
MTAVADEAKGSAAAVRFPWGVSRAGLLVLVVAQFLIGLDAAIATVAMPTIEREMSIGAASIQWTVIGYMVAAAALAVPVGAFGDRIGKRRVYVVGLAVFTVGSLMCAASSSGPWLVAGRIVSGCGAAAIGVLALAILTSAVHEDCVPKIVGLWAALSSVASCLAPMLSGLLVQTVGWRWLFGVNVVPLALITVVAVWKVPDSSVHAGRRVGSLGSALMVASVLLIAGGLSLSERYGHASVEVVVAVLCGLALLVVFALQQRHTSKPLTDWSVIGKHPIPAVLALLAAIGLALTGAMFQETLLVQNAFDYSPLLAGSLDVGPAVAFIVCATFASRLAVRFGIGKIVALGLLVSGIGVLAIGLTNQDPSPVALAAWFVLLGVGMGLTVPTLNATAMQRVSSASRGAVSGFLSLSSQLSAVVGIALLGGIAAAATRQSWLADLSDNQRDESLIGKVVSGAIANINDNYGITVANAADVAYEYGVILSLLAGAVGLLAAAVAAVFWLRGVVFLDPKPRQ